MDNGIAHWFNHQYNNYEAFNNKWDREDLRLYFLLIFFGFFQGIGIVEVRFHVRFVCHLFLEFIVLVYYVVDKGSQHKTGEIDEALDFVGHDVEIWDN